MDDMPFAKILIVDDDIDDVEILTEAFMQTGVDRVHYVHTALQAFVYLQSLHTSEDLPKLIVTDMYLPGITSTGFLTGLKKVEQYKQIYVVVLSSVKTPNEVEYYKEMGADDYLLKPNTYDEYVKVARHIAEKHLYV